MRPRIVFCGTPAFAVPSLDALLDAGMPPRAVYTQPDRPAGRGLKRVSSPIRERAVGYGLPVFQPTSLKMEVTRLRSLAADLIVVVAYGLVLPPAVLAIPRLGCVNVHASLLPRWRGAAPIVRCIEAGDTVTGITLMQMDAGIDTGPILRQVREPIAETDTGGTLHDRLAALGGRTLHAALADIVAGRLGGEPQRDELATYAPKITPDEARIDWTSDAAAIVRRVRAFNPWPVAYTQRGRERLRVWQATALGADAGSEPGTVLIAAEGQLIVQAGAGRVALTAVQRSGGRVQPVETYLRGARVSVGERFGEA